MVNEYGDVRSSPSLVEPLKNSTFETEPSESEAEALMATLIPAEKLDPFAGEVMLTFGATFAAGAAAVVAQISFEDADTDEESYAFT